MRHATFCEVVFLRPKMYTLTGTFEEAVCFVEGYTSGAAKSAGNAHTQAVDMWLKVRNAIKEEYGDSDVGAFLKFRDNHGSSACLNMAEFVRKVNGLEPIHEAHD